MARAPTSIAMEPAMPHSSEPPAKITMQVMKTVRRPNRSPNLPITAVATVEANR
ncbi:Uncharacterised protein [Mycobacteroides abscessus subsp. abscessus]|nr:Uncharacterised protein [Mycobacteroides abscessus subsp. abscessus]